MTDDLKRLGDGIGRTQLVVCTEDTLEPLPGRSGDEGELVIVSEQCGIGYMKLPEQTAARFLQHPRLGGCFRTGDIFLFADGAWRFVGRKDSQIKLMGRRVELSEIEALVSRSCQGLGVTVVAATFADSFLVAWCVAADQSKEQSSVLKEALRLVCETDMPAYMIPGAFEVLDAVPLTTSGKVDYAELRRLAIALPADEGCKPLEGTWQELVARVWKLTLGVAPNATSNFFRLGGDSLLAVRVCRRVAELLELQHDFADFGTDSVLNPQQLLERPELSAYAAFLESTFESRLDHRSRRAPDSGVPFSRIGNLIGRAASVGHLAVVRVLLDHHKSVHQHDLVDNSSALVAAANNHLEVLKALLDGSVASMSAKNPSGASLLHLAAANASAPQMVSFLLSRQAYVDAKDDEGQTPLHYAARLGSSTKMLELLLEAADGKPAVGNSRKGRNSNGDARKSQDSVEKRLNATDKWGRTALFWATLNGHRTAVAYLMDAKASISALDSFGETPLMAAERRARCGAQDRGNGLRPSVFGDIAALLGGSGKSKQVAKYI